MSELDKLAKIWSDPENDLTVDEIKTRWPELAYQIAQIVRQQQLGFKLCLIEFTPRSPIQGSARDGE